jgi:hypothetical protein
VAFFPFATGFDEFGVGGEPLVRLGLYRPAAPRDERDAEVQRGPIEESDATYRPPPFGWNRLGWVVLATGSCRELGIHDGSSLR